jgi:hypothetical protein
MSFFKNGEWEGKTRSVWGLAPVGGGGCKERVQRMNMVEYYALVYENGTMRNCRNYSRNGEGDKGE